MPYRVVGADAICFIVLEWAHDKPGLMSRNGLHVTEPIRYSGNIFMFVAGEGPELPASESITMAYVVKRVNVIVGDDIPFPALPIERKHDE